MLPVHLAESRREAMADVRAGSGRFVVDYQHAVLGRPLPDCPADRIVDEMVASGPWIVGDARRLRGRHAPAGRGQRGYGGLMVMAMERTSREKGHKRYELPARYAAPQFQGSTAGIEGSYRQLQLAPPRRRPLPVKPSSGLMPRTIKTPESRMLGLC